VQAPGFVAGELVEDAVKRALCLLFPSKREGYGLVVVEAAAVGTPTVVVDAPDNAAVELVEDGVNGFVAKSAEPEELGNAIVRVHEAGPALRESTADWFRRNRQRLSVESSVERVLAVYGRR
jgi:glycosyltransferase involved in cell wall biosynthesis